MSKDHPEHDLGFDETGQVIAIGEDAARQQDEIIGHPDAKPVLVVATLDGNIGIRVYGPPSEETAELLDEIAAHYRQTLRALAEQRKVRG